MMNKVPTIFVKEPEYIKCPLWGSTCRGWEGRTAFWQEETPGSNRLLYTGKLVLWVPQMISFGQRGERGFHTPQTHPRAVHPKSWLRISDWLSAECWLVDKLGGVKGDSRVHSEQEKCEKYYKNDSMKCGWGRGRGWGRAIPWVERTADALPLLDFKTNLR